MPDEPLSRDISADLLCFKNPLPHLAQNLRTNGKARIVAIGSSSTAGEGGIVPYPYRLEMALRDRYCGRFENLTIDVLNRGKGGEEAPKEVDRFVRDVIDEEPSLVIWQLGANAVFHQEDFTIAQIAEAVAAGLSMLEKVPADVILMDPQYLPAVLRDERIVRAEQVVSLIASAAEAPDINLFRRFALMRHWHVHDNVTFDQMLDPTDNVRLHQSDWMTGCVTNALERAIAEAVGRVSPSS